MNSLPPNIRARIFELRECGKTNREICTILGVSRESVAAFSPNGYRRQLFKLASKLWDELEKKGIEPWNLRSLMDLHHTLGWTCPIHPNAEPDVDVGPDGCRLCLRDGMRRFHERRREQGKPVLPPWRKPKPTEPEPERQIEEPVDDSSESLPSEPEPTQALHEYVADRSEEAKARTRVPPPKPIRIIPQLPPEPRKQPKQH